MNEWFGPETSALFPWLSMMSLVALTSIWVERGQHKKAVIGIYIASIAFGLLLLVSGIVARVIEQPVWVTRPLLMAGVLITVVFAATWPLIAKGYAKAEQRKTLARDI